MQAKLINNAPKARCYKCATTKVQYICHHCGRLMCDRHTFFTAMEPKTQTNNQNNNNTSTIKRKLLSNEFTKLNLGDTECGEEPYHCSDCIHLMRGVAWKRILIGSLLFLISFMAIPNNRLGTKFLFFVTGGGLVGYEIYANRQRKKQITTKRPPLPVLPNFDKVQITETLKGNIILDTEGKYDVSVSSAQGQLDIEISLKGEDYERLEKYYRPKYGLADKFHAGFIVLQGAAGIQFNQDVLASRVIFHSNNTIIGLIDDIKNQPILMGSNQLNSHKKQINLNYNLIKKPDSNLFPIQIVIAFFPGTDQRGLEIGIQWLKPKISESYDNPLRKIQITQIELLELKFPVAWGRVENLNFRDNVSYREDSQIINWRKIPISPEAEKECRCNFVVQFENQIEPLEHNSYIQGKVKVIYKSSLSGIENINLYFPTGKQNHSFKTKKSNIQAETTQTEVELAYELSLANLRYQHIRIFPEDEKTTEQRTLDFYGVSPTYKSITLLTDSMSSPEQGFYVKQVVENQPTINAALDLLNRSWTIFGRWYEGVYPIDFQIYLNGYEKNDDIQELLKMTRVRLTVEGTYSNSEMKQQIENVWEQLETIVQNTFHQISDQEDWKIKELPSSDNEENSVPMEAVFEEDDDEETYL